MFNVPGNGPKLTGARLTRTTKQMDKSRLLVLPCYLRTPDTFGNFMESWEKIAKTDLPPGHCEACDATRN
jgi:hypothetical protein